MKTFSVKKYGALENICISETSSNKKVGGECNPIKTGTIHWMKGKLESDMTDKGTGAENVAE